MDRLLPLLLALLLSGCWLTAAEREEKITHDPSPPSDETADTGGPGAS